MHKFILLLLFCLSLPVHAAGNIHRVEVGAEMPKVYQAVYQELESRRLFVVFEPDMGRTIAGLAERLGEDYNRNRLEGIRSMVVCNAWYTNQVSNLDPDMLALCPVRVTVIHKEGVSTILFARPSVHAQGSPALPVIEEIEALVTEAIDTAAAGFSS